MDLKNIQELAFAKNNGQKLSCRMNLSFFIKPGILTTQK